MTFTLSTPSENPLHTPLPWLLAQTSQSNVLLGRQSRAMSGIAHVASSSDAMLIFKAVHSYYPMLAVLQMVKASLRSESCCRGPCLSMHLHPAQYLLLRHALAIAQSEAPP